MRFVPDVPHKGYAFWKSLTFAGIRIKQGVGPADATFYWEDSTKSTIVPDASWINGCCTDISKVRIARAHMQVFGYSAEVDPTTCHRPFVEKSDENGLHDGRLVHESKQPESGKVYQRYIDTLDADGFICDFRAIVLSGKVRRWLLSKRPGSRPFGKFKASCEILREPPVCREELDRIESLCTVLGLECGELDVLRDRLDGRIYVVDVNKTTFGPNKSLRIGEMLEIIRLFDREFKREYLTGKSAEPKRAESCP